MTGRDTDKSIFVVWLYIAHALTSSIMAESDRCFVLVRTYQRGVASLNYCILSSFWQKAIQVTSIGLTRNKPWYHQGWDLNPGHLILGAAPLPFGHIHAC